MADPVKFSPDYSYTGWQAGRPSKPLPAPRIDDDFANIQRTTDETIDALKEIRRSDGKLQNGIVTEEALETSLSAGIRAVPGQAAAAALSAEVAVAAAVAAGVSASDAVSQGNVPIYGTALGLGALPIPDGINFLRTNGYSSADGAGAASYRLRGSLEADGIGDQPSNGGAKRWALAPNQTLTLEAFGARANDPSFDNTAAINAAFQASSERNLLIIAAPVTYWHSGTINQLRRATRFAGVVGQTRFKLTPAANLTQLETYNFAAFLAANAYAIEDYPDLTIGWSLENLILDGSKADQTPGLYYGARLYGRRYNFRNIHIAEQGGVGLWTVQKGSGGNGVDGQKTPNAIDQIQISNSFYENWIFEGPADTGIGVVRTIGAGDFDAAADKRTSLHFPGEPIHGVRVLDAFTAADLNLNTARWGRVLHFAPQVRMEIGTCILAGGNGLLYTSTGCWGHIANLTTQANRFSDSQGGPKPFVERFDRQVQIGAMIGRRVVGQDTAAPYYVDNGGAYIGSVIGRNGSADPGHGVVLNAPNGRVGDMHMQGLSGTAADGTQSAGLITNATFCKVVADIFNCGVGWRNLAANPRITGEIHIAVNQSGVTGQALTEGVFASPNVWSASLRVLALSLKDGNTELNNSFIGEADFNPAITTEQQIVFTHGLNRIPARSEILLSVFSSASPRVNFEIEPRVLSNVSGGSTQITVVLKLSAATSGGTNKIICRVN